MHIIFIFNVIFFYFFFFNDTATTEIYTLSLHDALPISGVVTTARDPQGRRTVVDLVDHPARVVPVGRLDAEDRKSTRLNSSHVEISYAVFCLKKKKNIYSNDTTYRVKCVNDEMSKDFYL